jgi:DNA transposition AAA+ family ATPase
MNLERKQQIQKGLVAYLKEHEISQKDFSGRAGVPKEYITNIVNDNYDYSAGKDKVYQIPERHFSVIADFIDLDEKIKIWKTLPTSQLTQTIAILEEAKENAYTRVVIGETGSGKSLAKELFRRKHPTSVITVTVGSQDSLSALLDKVCKALRVPHQGRHKSQKIRDISLALQGIFHHGHKPQLIFDESEYLRPAALCSIKEFYDYLDEYCSIILIGTSQLTDEIEKLRKQDKKGIPQLYRRIKFGIRKLPSIDRTFTDFLNDITDRGLKTFLRRECANYGELHDVLVPSIRESKRLGEPLTLELVKTVINFTAY